MANKYLSQVAGVLTEVEGTTSGGTVGDAGKIVALDGSGLLNANMMPSGMGVEVQSLTVVTDTLVAGDFVNITTNGVRKADASNNRPAHGFVLTGASPAALINVYSPSQANNGLTTLTMGTTYFLGANGAVTSVAPTGSGYCSQIVGVANSATTIVFTPSTPITLA